MNSWNRRFCVIFLMLFIVIHFTENSNGSSNSGKSANLGSKDLSSLAIPKKSNDRIIQRIPANSNVKEGTQVRVGMLCVDEWGRSIRSDQEGYGDCMDKRGGNMKKNDREGRELEMKVQSPF
jgi:hypothetical protein